MDQSQEHYPQEHLSDKPDFFTDEKWAKHLEENSDLRALRVLNALKCELSMRPDNEHIGSGLGGNAGELFFLLTNDVRPIISYTDPKNVGWFQNEDRETKKSYIELRLAPKKQGEKRNMKTVRQSLTEFCNRSHTRQMDFDTFLSLVPALEPLTLDMHLLKQAFKMAASLRADLQHTIKLQESVLELSKKEEKDLEIAFCQSIGVKHEEMERHNQLDRMMRKHPVFGPKVSNKEERFSQISKLLLSETYISTIKAISTYPSYISILTMRTQFGIDLIVSLDLDVHMDTAFSKEVEADEDEEE